MKNKRVFAALTIALAMMLTMMIPNFALAAGTATVSASASPATADPGDTVVFTVTVSAAGPDLIGGFQASTTYDSDLTFVSASGMPAGWISNANGNAVAGFGATPQAVSSFTLTYTFTVKSGAAAGSALDFAMSVTAVTDANGASMTSNSSASAASHVTAEVVNATPTPTPIPTPTPTPVQPTNPGTTVNLYSVDVKTDSNGTASPAGINYVSSGHDFSLTFAPKSGYVLDSLKVDGVKQTVTGTTFELNNVTENHRIEITFTNTVLEAPQTGADVSIIAFVLFAVLLLIGAVLINVKKRSR